MKDKDKEIEWRYEASTKTIRSVPANYWIASMDSWDGAVDHEANAKLIAAAPEMLGAMELAITYFDDGAIMTGIDILIRAINKAKGKK